MPPARKSGRAGARGITKREVSRAQVLDAAMACVAERGLERTTVQDIADHAGLSKGAVHYHFESKDALLEAALVRACEVIEARIRAAFDEEGPPALRVQRALVEMWTLRRDGSPAFRLVNELFTAAHQRPSLKKALAAQLRNARRQLLVDGLERVIAMGLRPRVPTEAIPRLVLAALDGLAIHHGIDPIEAEEEAAILGVIQAGIAALFEL